MRGFVENLISNALRNPRGQNFEGLEVSAGESSGGGERELIGDVEH